MSIVIHFMCFKKTRLTQFLQISDHADHDQKLMLTIQNCRYLFTK